MVAESRIQKTSPSARIIFSLSFVVFLFVTLLWTFAKPGSLHSPPAPWNTDGVFYDNIAFNIDQGKGFYVDLNAEPWRSTYVAANEDGTFKGKYDWMWPVKGTGFTALRSPAYPYALAAIYRTFGTEHFAARMFGCIWVSLGVAMLLTFAVARWGILAGLISTATLTVDYSVMQSAGTLATESLAILVFAATFLLAVRAFESPNRASWALCGVSFGVLLLTRGIWNLGLLMMIAALILVTAIPKLRNRFVAIRPMHGLCFLIAATCVAAPWWIRNCMVTEHFQPFGTAGSCGFVAAYCDESLQDFGQWQPDVFNANQIDVQSELGIDRVSLAHLEYAIGIKSVETTKQWCVENWRQLPKLMFYRALSHWGVFNQSVPMTLRIANIWLVVVGLLGCIFCTGRLKGLFVLVLVLDSLLVMLTWEHLGRYAIPIRPVVHLGYGLAMSTLIRFLLRLRLPRVQN